MKKFDILEAYRETLNEDASATAGATGFVGVDGAPNGAMSSSPEVNKIFRPTSPDDPKFSIYNIFSKKKKDFTTEAEAKEFLENNPDWKANDDELKLESYINILNQIIGDNLTESEDNQLLESWKTLSDDFEILKHQTGKWLSKKGE